MSTKKRVRTQGKKKKRKKGKRKEEREKRKELQGWKGGKIREEKRKK